MQSFNMRLRAVQWHIGNGVGLITGGSTNPNLSRATQRGHPVTGRCNEYWQWFRPPLWKKRRVLRSSRPCCRDCWHTGLLYASL